MAKLNQAELEILLPTLTLRSPEDSMRSTPSSNWGSVIDSIYAHQKSNFMSRLASPCEVAKPALTKTHKMTVFAYPDPHKKLFIKEDGFFNPSALYLSRKPLVFNRNYRKETQAQEKVINLSPSRGTPSRRKRKTQVNRRSLTQNKDYDPLKLLKKDADGDQFDRVLNKTRTKVQIKQRNEAKQVETKSLREEVLKKIDKDCKDMRSFRNISPKVETAKKLVDDYRKNIEWTATVLKDYPTQQSEVLRQLYFLSDYARIEMNKDMALTAEQIRRGSMDPALKHRAKKKKMQFV